MQKLSNSFLAGKHSLLNFCVQARLLLKAQEPKLHLVVVDVTYIPWLMDF